MFRFETLLVAALLGSPVAALWLRGDFNDADVWWRFGLCWLVAWAAVSVLAVAARPLTGSPADDSPADDSPADDSEDSVSTTEHD